MQFRRLLKKDVERIIDECCLSEEQEHILWLRVEGNSIVKIADRLHISTATVDRRIREIKNKMMEL